MLTDAFAALLTNLDDDDWLKTKLAGVGAKHVEYGVTPEMYVWAGECLLSTLARAAGATWTTEAEQAWREAYDDIVRLMQTTDTS